MLPCLQGWLFADYELLMNFSSQQIPYSSKESIWY